MNHRRFFLFFYFFFLLRILMLTVTKTQHTDGLFLCFAPVFRLDRGDYAGNKRSHLVLKPCNCRSAELQTGVGWPADADPYITCTHLPVASEQRGESEEITSVMCAQASMSLPVTFDPISIHQRGPSDPSVYSAKWTSVQTPPEGLE